jgi:hypothetical protein
MKVPLLISLFTVLILSFIYGGAFTVAILYDKHMCIDSAIQNEVEYRWSIFAGCSYKQDNFWIPKENYRVLK